MNITVKKAVAINAWDIFCNGVFIERFPKKKEAYVKFEELVTKYGGMLS